MKNRARIIFMAVLIFLLCGMGLLSILFPNEELPPLPTRQPDFEIKLMNPSCVAFSPDGKQIAIGHMDGWDLFDFNTREMVDKHRWKESYVSQISFSPDGRRLLTSRDDENIILWDIETKKELFRLDKIGFCTSIGFSLDGSKIVAAVGQRVPTPGYAAIWDIKTGKSESVFRTSCNRAVYAPDQKSVVLTHVNQVERWGIDIEDKVKDIAVFKQGIVASGFSVDGKQMLAALFNAPAKLIDIESGSILKEFKNTKGWLKFAGLSQNSSFALVGDSGGIPMKASKADILDKIPFSEVVYPRRCKGGLYVYSTASGEGIVRLAGYDMWYSFALSADRSMAAGVTQGSVCFWDISNIVDDTVADSE